MRPTRPTTNPLREPLAAGGSVGTGEWITVAATSGGSMAAVAAELATKARPPRATSCRRPIGAVGGAPRNEVVKNLMGRRRRVVGRQPVAYVPDGRHARDARGGAAVDAGLERVEVDEVRPVAAEPPGEPHGVHGGLEPLQGERGAAPDAPARCI